MSQWMELKIQDTNRKIKEAEDLRKYALQQLIDRDSKIADLENRLNSSVLLLEESMQIINGPENIEVTDSYINRSKAFVCSNSPYNNLENIVDIVTNRIQKQSK